MYRHPDNQLCYTDSVHKDWVIEVVGEDPIGNDILLQDEITLTDPLCSKDDITLGCCESATFEFKIRNLTDRTFKDKKIKVSIILNNHTNTPIPMGEFKVDEEELEDDQRTRKLKAHDALYEISNKDFAPWFNNLPSGQSITCKDFRDSFFQYAGVEQETVELINDWIPFQFVVTNSGATDRMLKEESEKIQQAIDKAEAGINVIVPNLIDPNTYDEWESRVETTHTPIYKWTPTYTEVQNPPANSNPKQNGWWERTADGGYIQTKDKKLKNKKYYTKDAAPNVDPEDEAWAYICDDPTAQRYNDFVAAEEHSPVENRQYYEVGIIEHRSPAEWGWYQQYVDGSYDYTEDDEIKIGKNYYLMETIEPELPKYVKVTEFHEGDNPAEKEWYTYDQASDEYSRTDHTYVHQNTDYFEIVVPKNKNTAFIDLTPYIDAHRLDNPKELGWYELINNAYDKTNDETVDQTKHYYENIWEINQNEEKDVVEDQILGADIIQAICEINGRFGHMYRDGKFHYVRLKPIDFDDEGLYPEPELYPDPTLYPQGQPFDELLTRSKYEEVVRKDYYVKKIDRLVICKEDGDAGYVYPADSIPDNHNTYKITGNFIWYSFTGDKETLSLAGNNLLNEGIAQISEHMPCEIDMMGNPCLDVGDTLKVETRLGTFYTYVLNRTLTNSQRLIDSIEVNGKEEREPENSLYDAVISLKGKSNILTRSVDETRSEILDVSENLTSLIKQTADAITLSVSKEVKKTDEKLTEKYEAATKYTDSMIKDTVSKEVYNDNQNKIAYQFSEFERLSYQISATVEDKLDAEGEGTGFKWVLNPLGFVLQAKGGYTIIAHPDPDADPSALGWYERDATTHQMKPSEDTEVDPDKTYYTANESSNYHTVFECNSKGVWVENAVSTDMLDVRTQAIMNVVNITTGHVNDLSADVLRVENDLGTATAKIDKIETKALKAVNIETGTINATYITGGTMSAERISMETLTPKVGDALKIQATQESPSKGKIVIGHVATAEYYVLRTNSSGGKYYFKLIPMSLSEAVRQNKTVYVVDDSQSYTTNQIPDN